MMPLSKSRRRVILAKCFASDESVIASIALFARNMLKISNGDFLRALTGIDKRRGCSFRSSGVDRLGKSAKLFETGRYWMAEIGDDNFGPEK